MTSLGTCQGSTKHACTGFQYRNVTCFDTCGLPVDDAFCSEFEEKPEERVTCSLPCLRNCVTSEFGAWSSCDGCFRSHKSRFRTVVRTPQNGGLECRDVSETFECNLDRTCFESRTDNFLHRAHAWSACEELRKNVLPRQLRRTVNRAKANHVIGMQRRNVTCVNATGYDAHQRWVRFLALFHLLFALSE